MPKTILIIDDLFETAIIFSLILKRKGYECLKTSSAPDALTILEAHTPDLILCDNNMPGMDGYEFCTLIRQREETGHIPFVMMVYTSIDHVKDKIQTVSVDDIWVLPMLPADVQLRVAAIIGPAD